MFKDYFLVGLIIISFVGLTMLNFNSNQIINDKLIGIETGIDDKLINIETGLNYLYASETNLTTSFEERQNKFPNGSYTDKLSTLILVTKNFSNQQICSTFMHEIGHKQCYPDLTEECANEFETNNLWRCETI